VSKHGPTSNFSARTWARQWVTHAMLLLFLGSWPVEPAAQEPKAAYAYPRREKTPADWVFAEFFTLLQSSARFI